MSERGERGPMGPVGPARVGEQPHERKFKHDVDRRLMVLYLVLILILGLAITFFQYTTDKAEDARREFEKKIVTNCETNKANTQTLNDFIDVLVKRIDASTEMSAQEKSEAKKLYGSLRQTVPECPPATS